jgi:NAD+ synthase (glutamine-hydrolysing)
MKLAIAQVNPVLGDLTGNVARLAACAEQARQRGAQLLLTPEFALCGYSPEDLLLRHGFYAACANSLHELAAQTQGISMVVGHPHEEQGKFYNAASLLRDGSVLQTYLKRELPNYAVFDEERYFEHGVEPCLFEIGNTTFAINICADIWQPHTAHLAQQAGAQVLLVLNASPYAMGKQEARYRVARDRVSETGMALIYANMVGGQDELIFDGGSFALNGQGHQIALAARFQEEMLLLEVQGNMQLSGSFADSPLEDEAVYQALCLGVRDYVLKNGFPGVLLGLSGGIDSALTLAVAVDALGADKVQAVMMPSPYTAQISLDDAREMAGILGVRYKELPIWDIYQSYETTLRESFAGRAADTAEENLQARIRGALIMALSNKFGALVLTTGNKSEMTVGYATLYGDMAGGFAVLKDVSKTMVYRLARYRNTQGYVIPERIINRPPSAELRPDQTDQDSLPPYDVLDAIMACYVEQSLTVNEIIERGYLEADVRRVVRLIHISEYKRRQSAVGVRITERSYGKDWRYPITARYQDNF